MTNLMRRLSICHSSRKGTLAFPERSRPAADGGWYSFKRKKPIMIRRDHLERRR